MIKIKYLIHISFDNFKDDFNSRELMVKYERISEFLDEENGAGKRSGDSLRDNECSFVLFLDPFDGALEGSHGSLNSNPFTYLTPD